MVVFRDFCVGVVFLALGPSIVAQDTHHNELNRLRPHIRTIGNSTFTQAQINQELSQSLDFVAASLLPSRDAPLEQTINRLVRRGYRNGGFRDVRVDSLGSSEGWVCHIDEGPRFRCGDLVIQTDDSVSLEALNWLLTTKRPPADTIPSFVIENGIRRIQYVNQEGDTKDLEDAIWETGKPASFDRLDRIKKDTQKTLRTMGYPAAQFDLEMRADDGSRTVDLIMDLKSRGKRTIVEGIEIEGTTIQSHSAIKDFIPVQVGDVVTEDLITNVTASLWTSGRFREQVVRLDPTTNRLVLNLTDKLSTPPINEPISPDAELFLRAGQSMSSRGRELGDQVFEMDKEGCRLRLVVSDLGTIFQISLNPDLTSKPSRDGKRHQQTENRDSETLTLILDRSGIFSDISSSNTYFSTNLLSSDHGVHLTLSFGASNEAERLITTKFAGEIKSKRDPSEPSLRVGSLYRPSDWLPFAYRRADSIKRSGGKLVLDDGNYRFVIEEETGVLLEASSGRSTHSVIDGEFARIRAKALNDVKSKTNLLDRSKLATSLFGYFADRRTREFIQRYAVATGDDEPMLTGPLADGCERLIDGGALTMIDESVANFVDQEQFGDEFQVDDRKFDPDSRGLSRWMYGSVVWFLANRSQDLQGWPLELFSTVAISLTGTPEQAAQAIDDYCIAGDQGPISMGLLAALLRYTEREQSIVIAQMAKERLNQKGFESDLPDLLKSSLGRTILRSLMVMQKMPDDERSALVTAMGDGRWSSLITEATTLARENPNPSNERVFEISYPILDHWLNTLTMNE